MSGFVIDLTRSPTELIAENALLRQQLIVASRKVKRARERSLMEEGNPQTAEKSTVTKDGDGNSTTARLTATIAGDRAHSVHGPLLWAVCLSVPACAT